MSKIRPDHDSSTTRGALLIVVGAHLHAERVDRPAGYRLRDAILARFPLDAVVCSDLWYMNQPDLMDRPTIAVGGPGVNAATAHFMNRLPVAFMIEGTLEVRLDLQSRPPAAAIWGMDDDATADAVKAFSQRYLDSFLRALGD